LTEFLELFPLLLPSEPVLKRAAILQRRDRWSFWDAMIAAACLEGGVSRLYSEDLPGRPAPGLEIVNPFF